MTPRFARSRRRRTGFSLLEVMIASGIFFMASFAILALVSQSLRGARSLQRPPVDAGMVAAILTATNRYELGTQTGEFEDDALRDYSWARDTYEIGTNGLLGIDIVLEKRGLKQPFDKLSIVVYDPNFRATPVRPPSSR
jgi:hypothetical protein